MEKYLRKKNFGLNCFKFYLLTILFIFLNIYVFKVFAQPTINKVSNVNTIQSEEFVTNTLTLECSKLVGSCSNVDESASGFKFQESSLNLASIFDVELKEKRKLPHLHSNEKYAY